MSIVIEGENLSKIFRIRTRQISLRHEAMHLIRKRVSRHAEGATPTNAPFYALKNVSFAIKRGEAVAIVGRNGAGKTTLLRIIARIMRPTEGRVSITGKYAALIGVGAGFVNTLSGRKNIYLTAAIHGINPVDIEARVEDIIRFADIGDYIDMPVKDYSSGMLSRLGFSIAVHTLPDIVLIDEVLSVGDVAFQKKSHAYLAKMLADNRTLVLVSHSERGIRELCTRALWLHNGRLMMNDSADTVLNEYNRFMQRYALEG